MDDLQVSTGQKRAGYGQLVFEAHSQPIMVSMVLLVFMVRAGNRKSVMIMGKNHQQETSSPGRLPPSSAEDPENSSKTIPDYEEVDLLQIEPTDVRLTENAAYGEFHQIEPTDIHLTENAAYGESNT